MNGSFPPELDVDEVWLWSIWLPVRIHSVVQELIHSKPYIDLHKYNTCNRVYEKSHIILMSNLGMTCIKSQPMQAIDN